MDTSEILYVDDEEINLMIFQIALCDRYNVLSALDAKEGLEILNTCPNVKIVFSDMRMPNMTGIEFIKKAKEQFPDRIFYLITGFEITDEIRNALDTGLIKKYYKKPFELEKIAPEIELVLESFKNN